MLSTTLLINKLRTDFPQFIFTPTEEFRWSPEERTIFYDQTTDDQASLLHELSHAILGHKEYAKDIELIKLERDAWMHARMVLTKKYDVAIDVEQIEDALDTYRDWLHARSTCPACHATGIQAGKNNYKCLACLSKWRINDARACALRRYKMH